MGDKTIKSVAKKQQTSFRQKAEKAAANSDQPRRLHATRARATAPLRAVGKIARKANKVKPLRILGFIIVPPYFRNSFRELRQVTWPKGRDSLRLTGSVIVFAIGLGVMVAAVDFVLDKVFKGILLK